MGNLSRGGLVPRSLCRRGRAGSYRIWDSEAGAGEAWLISYENDALKTFTTEDAAKQACEAHLKRVLTEALNVLEGGK